MLDAELRRQQYRPDALLEILHAAQSLFGYLSADVLGHVGRGLKLPLSRVYGVATFYSLFALAPRGLHTCTVCMGTACYVKRAGEILAGVEQAHGVKAGQTTGDGRLTLEVAHCVGTCGIAPVVIFDEDMTGRQREETVLARLEAWSVP
jgi:bidirectional [NiFe] hydrogenase diaphorase subunit